MKKICFLLLFAAAGRAEAQFFAPLPTEEAVWANVVWSGWVNAYGSISKTAIHGDTLIDGAVYKKVFWQEGPLFDINLAQFVGALRQTADLPGPKIWMRWPGENTDRLLYDFTVAPGDTASIMPYFDLPDLTVEKEVLDYVQVPNTPLWAMKFNSVYVYEHWISGIGSTKGLLLPFLDAFDADFYLAFTCQNGNLVFQNNESLGMANYPNFLAYLQSVYGDQGLNPCADDEFALEPSSGTAQTAREPAWSLRPNPAADYVDILPAEPLNSETVLEFFAPDGRFLSRQTLPAGAGSARISLAAFPDGLLTIRLTGRLESRQFRLLKTGR